MKKEHAKGSRHSATRARMLAICALVGAVLIGVLVAQAAQAATSAYDVTTFGAKGDGGTDNTAIFQGVIDRAGTTPVYIPAGTYVVTGSLALRSGLTLYGAGSASVIKLV